MLRYLLILTSLLVSISTQDIGNYARSNVLKNCFGEEPFLQFTKDVAKASRICMDMPIYINMAADDILLEEGFMRVFNQDDVMDEGSGDGSEEEGSGFSDETGDSGESEEQEENEEESEKHEEEDKSGDSSESESEQSAEEEEESDKSESEQSAEEEDETDESQPEKPESQQTGQAFSDTWNALMDFFMENTDESNRPIVFPISLLLLPEGQQALLRRRKREVLYDSTILQRITTEVKAKISNFTCTLQELGMIDEDYNINITQLTTSNYNIDEVLQEEVNEGVRKCHQFSNCLPADQMKAPLPKSLQRLFAFAKCSKKSRMKICMKEHTKKHLEIFDPEALAQLGGDEDEMAEGLLHIFWGTETKDFDIY